MNTLNSSGEIPGWMTIPSDFIIPERRAKRDPGPVDFSVLDESQTVAMEQLMAYVEGKSKFSSLLVTGWAGCGKTFLISRLIEWLVYAKKFSVAATAPTNKAVGVSKEMGEIKHKLLQYSTLHKLLGLKEGYDQFGRLKFTTDPNEFPSLDGFNVLIVDEVSMLDDFIANMLFPYTKHGLKLIFVGDPCQIPPVNHIDAIPLLSKKQKEHNIGVIALTKMHRQAMDNPILTLATAIRENIQNDFSLLDFKTDIRNNSGVIFKPRNDREIIYQICDAYFANTYFEEYADFCKVIAWRNVAVDAINTKVRELIFKKTGLPGIMVGEKLLADEPIKDRGGYLLYTTNAEFIVVNYTEDVHNLVFEVSGHVVGRQKVKYYKCTVKGTQISDERNFGKEREIWVIHNDSKAEFKQNLKKMNTQILTLDRFVRMAEWSKYYYAKNMFAGVKYNYAITAHKSQGSSYENVMVLDWDISGNPKIEERNRIKYVSDTRARKYLFIIN